MSGSFSGFTQSDFAAFTDTKRENSLFNGERKVVWKKMKKLQIPLEVELKRHDFPLKGKISQYWINYTKRHVNGIWLAYTDIEPYYIVCQLNCGIYRDGFFVGIEINSKARSHLENAASYINQNRDEFLSIIKKLNSRYFRMSYGSWEANSTTISLSDLNGLLDAFNSERAWFDLGEWYPRTESFLATNEFIPKIPGIFETLFPLYLIFVGRRPAGQSRTDKLLRLSDVQKKDLVKAEKALVSEISSFDTNQLDELIAAIDTRNKAEAPHRSGRSAQTYRRNPVLSAALKKKHADRCQACGENFKVDRGFFCDTHHVNPLRQGGLDVSDNILVLCPNHHRFFDRSKYEIIAKDKSVLTIRVGEKILKIPL